MREVETPKPRVGEVLVQVAYCGICGTDYHIYRGEFLSPYPLVPGHEFSGTVCAIGPDAEGWSVGDRVTVDPSLFCGHCYYCQRRHWNHCAHWGALGNTVDGAFAEYVRVPVRNLHRVPDGMSLLDAAFTEPLACVVWGLERLRVFPGDRVLLFGAGAIGCLWTQGLALTQASLVAVVDIAEEKLRMARTLGAMETYQSGPDLETRLLSRTDGHGFDVVVDATGVPSVIQAMFRFAGKRARILQFGVAPAQAEIVLRPFDVYHNDWEIIGSMAVNYTMAQALDLLASGRIRVSPLATRQEGLAALPAILGAPKPAGEMKTFICPS